MALDGERAAFPGAASLSHLDQPHLGLEFPLLPVRNNRRIACTGTTPAAQKKFTSSRDIAVPAVHSLSKRASLSSARRPVKRAMATTRNFGDSHAIARAAKRLTESQCGQRVCSVHLVH